MESEGESEREPPLDELIEDPLTQALMARDGVDAAELRRLLARKRRDWFGRRRPPEAG